MADADLVAAWAPSRGGIIVVDKPAGITSHAVVAKVRRATGIRRVGHAGTLDPMATGVLVVCLGLATRVVEYVVGCRKEYLAGIRFGQTTDTDDITGETRRTCDAADLTVSRTETALEQFRGPILQIPPMYSAVHHEGRRLYQLARKGQEVERSPREVTIHALELISFDAGSQPEAQLRIVCSSGTYIRTLAADIGSTLGVGAVMSSLRRTRVGPFSIADAVSLVDIEAANRNAVAGLRQLETALEELPRIALSAQAATEILHGRSIASDAAPRAEAIALEAPDGVVLAIGRSADGIVKPIKVLSQPVRSAP